MKLSLGGQPPFLYLLALLSAIGGFLFGYDTGVVSGAMLLVEEDLLHGVSSKDEWHEGIVTATIGAAALFSFISGYVSQKFGRKPTILMASLVFTIGAVIMGASPSKEVLLVGRIIVGIGIGFSSSTVPLYIAEVSPESIRGILVTMNQLMVTFGILVSSLIDGAFAEVEFGWKYDFGIGALPSVFLMVGFFFCPESPRWLVSRGKIEEAKSCLLKIRPDNYDCDKELQEIVKVCDDDKKLVEESGDAMFLRMMKSAYVRKALLVGCLLQLFQQAAGINTVMYYSATIVEMAGVSSSNSTNIWIAAAINAVNFLCTFPGMYFIERLGRRTLTLIALMGIVVSLVLLGVGFFLANNQDPDVEIMSNLTYVDLIYAGCQQYKKCGECVKDEMCGFCFTTTDDGKVMGSCDGFNKEDGEGEPSYGSCSVEGSEYLWFPEVCPSDYGPLIITALCLYIFFFASGLGGTPWAVNAEIYPLWCRSTCVGLATGVNWCMNVVVSMTFLNLLNSLGRAWTFIMYAGISLLGWLIFMIILPETKGKTLEEMEELFSQPIWRLGFSSVRSEKKKEELDS